MTSAPMSAKRLAALRPLDEQPDIEHAHAFEGGHDGQAPTPTPRTAVVSRKTLSVAHPLDYKLRAGVIARAAPANPPSRLILPWNMSQNHW